MSYLVLARKWRPSLFSDLAGQDHVTRTLENAILQEKVAHAYIFSGPRGVGKTSAARILAAALNCDKGPTPEPCGECGACREIAAGRSMDVLEIDGASNRGIDEVRDLRENVHYMASAGKRKIYIIDEVHMLTTEAFNALLKTLEEPPSHVLFVFATTRVTKVPATILSRTIRFDFRRIDTRTIMKRLEQITTSEKIETDSKALHLVARAADGSMRDALSLLEQARAYGGGVLRAEETEEALGIIDEELLFDLSGSAYRSDPAGAIDVVNAMSARGRDPGDFLLALEEHLRNLLVARVSKDPSLLIDAPEETVERYRQEADLFTADDLIRMLSLLGEGAREIRVSPRPKLVLEMLLLRLVRMDSTVTLAEVLQRLKGGSGPAEQSPAPPTAGRRKPSPPPAQKGTEAARSTDAPKPESGSGEADPIREKWDGFLSSLRENNVVLASLLNDSRLGNVDRKSVELLFPRGASFQMEQALAEENRETLEGTIEEFFQAKRIVKGRIGSHAVEGEKEKKESIKKDPRMGRILDMLDGEISG